MEGVPFAPSSQHAYQYGYNNPLLFTDPSGEQVTEGGVIATCFGIAFLIPDPGITEGVCLLISLGVIAAIALPPIGKTIDAGEIAEGVETLTKELADTCTITWEYLLQRVAPEPEPQPEPEIKPEPFILPVGPGPERDQEGLLFFHYGTRSKIQFIMLSGTILPSLDEINPKRVRHGDGVYFTDIVPGSMSKARIARALYGSPFQSFQKSVAAWVAIDTSGLTITYVKPNIYLYPTILPLFVHIPTHGGHRFRRMLDTDSGPWWTLKPPLN